LKVAHGDKAKADLNIDRGMQFAKMDSDKFQSTFSDTVNKVSSAEQKIDNLFSEALGEDSNESYAQEGSGSGQTTAVPSKTQLLLDLKKLLDEGVLTQEEFDQQKQEILNSNGSY